MGSTWRKSIRTSRGESRSSTCSFVLLSIGKSRRTSNEAISRCRVVKFRIKKKLMFGKQTKKFVWRCKYNNEDNQNQATGPHFIENEMKTNKFNSILVSDYPSHRGSTRVLSDHHSSSRSFQRYRSNLIYLDFIWFISSSTLFLVKRYGT